MMRSGNGPTRILIAAILFCFLAGCRTVEPRAELTPRQARKDIQQFFSTAERVHVNIYAKAGRGGFEALRRKALDDAAATAETNGIINVEQLAYILYESAAALQDGHTTIQWYDLELAGRRFPSFRLAFDNGRWLIAAAADPGLAGLELIAVNDAPIREFLRPILDRCSGETMLFRASRFQGRQDFWFGFTRIFDGDGPYTLTLRTPAGEVRKAECRPVGYAEYAELAPESRGTLRPETGVEFFGDGTALFRYPAFRASETEKRKIEDVFRKVRERDSPDLILDLRGNGGGNSQMGDFIFRYIYDGAFTQYSKVLVKSRLGGAVWTIEGRERAYEKPVAFYGGRVWLLVDNATFSSAADFAAMFRDYRVGKIIGYETGGLAICFGDAYGFKLKYSGIPCTVSYKQFFGPRPRPGDDKHGILPDYAMSAEILAEFQTEKDPVLAWTLRHIREARGTGMDGMDGMDRTDGMDGMDLMD